MKNKRGRGIIPQPFCLLLVLCGGDGVQQVKQFLLRVLAPLAAFDNQAQVIEHSFLGVLPFFVRLWCSPPLSLAQGGPAFDGAGNEYGHVLPRSLCGLLSGFDSLRG